MKQIFIIITLLFSIIAQANTLNESTNRVVLKASQNFDQLQVNGNVVVECRFNPKYAGYIVYHHKNDDNTELIKCNNDSSTLIITADKDLNNIKSRIVVFCNGPIKSIEANNESKIVSYKLPRVPFLRITLNDNASIKLGDIETRRLDLVANSNSKINLDNTRAGELNMVGYENSSINIEVLRSRNTLIESNENAIINIENIKAESFTATANHNSKLNVIGKVLNGNLIQNDNATITSSDLKIKNSLIDNK